MKKFIFLFSFFPFLLGGCASKNQIVLDANDWKCTTFYKEYSEGYTTYSYINGVMYPMYVPSSESFECASYKLKKSVLQQKAKKE